MMILVRGVGDIGSAVAHRLFQEGYGVVLHDEPCPTTTRRGMAFADALFDGHATLDGVRAVRADDLEHVTQILAQRDVITVYAGQWEPLLAAVQHRVLVDARMRKHAEPEIQREYGDFTIALGPDLVAGHHADVVIETSWDGLGAVVTQGATLPLTGEPRKISGHSLDRYVYAPVEGVFCTKFRIGDVVRQGQRVAEIGSAVLTAPLDGVLRGLTRDGVPVRLRTKLIEVDPRGEAGEVTGIGERPGRIADAVLSAIRGWEQRRTAR